MDHMKNFLNICVSMPNMGAFVFYIVFIFLVPLFIIYIKNLDLLLYYLPLLVPIAIILQESGKDNSFSNLYPLKKTSNKGDYVGKVSKFIISAISMIAILYVTIVNTQRSNRQYGMAVGLTYLLIVFVLSPNILPLVIKEGDNFIIKQGIKTYHNWHKYLFGFLTLVAFIIMDVGLVTIYDKTL